MPNSIVENRTFDENVIGDHAQLVQTLQQQDIELFAAVSGDVNPTRPGSAFSAVPPSGASSAHLPSATVSRSGNDPFSLNGRRGLVLGIANETSIACGCARAFREAGAELAVTFVNERARAFVQPLAQQLGASIIAPCDVRVPGELEAFFQRIESEWGKLDFVLHSIAYAPKEDLHSRVTDCSSAGFAMAMDVSCHSFIGSRAWRSP